MMELSVSYKFDFVDRLDFADIKERLFFFPFLVLPWQPDTMVTTKYPRGGSTVPAKGTTWSVSRHAVNALRPTNQDLLDI